MVAAFAAVRSTRCPPIQVKIVRAFVAVSSAERYPGFAPGVGGPGEGKVS